MEHEQNKKLLLDQFNAQPVNFRTSDSLNLSGLLILREGAKRNLLVCHGYRMVKERLCSFPILFPQDNLLLFDHRAHGESEGDRTTIGYHEKKDVQAALKFLQTHDGTKNLPNFGIGISMGAVSLLGAACECQGFKGIVLDSSFAQLEDQASLRFSRKFHVFAKVFEMLAKRLFEYVMQFSLAEVDALIYAQCAQVPVLLIHSTHDAVSPLADVQKIYETIPSKKDLWVVENSHHAHIFHDCMHEYGSRVNQFFDSVTI